MPLGPTLYQASSSEVSGGRFRRTLCDSKISQQTGSIANRRDFSLGALVSKNPFRARVVILVV